MNLRTQRAAFGVPTTVSSGCSGRRISTAFLMMLMALSFASAQQTSLEQVPFHVGFTRSAFRNVNTTDAEAAFMAFARTVGQQRGYLLDTSTRVFETLPALEAEIKKRNLTLVVMDSWEYLHMNMDAEMEPAFVHLNQSAVLKEYLLLTRRESGLNTPADLRDKDIAVLDSASNSLAMAWLETLLLEQDLGTPDTFFCRVDRVAKPSTAVLPVFFGSKPACVVDRPAFETMVEMNPQVGIQLVKVAISEPYLNSITFMTRHGYISERARQDLIDSLAELHQEPAGRQILTLFKVDQLVPFKEEYMKSVRDLRAKWVRLLEKHLLSCLDSARILAAEQARLRGVIPKKGAVAAGPGAVNP